jgi:hypothetical protein
VREYRVYLIRRRFHAATELRAYTGHPPDGWPHWRARFVGRVVAPSRAAACRILARVGWKRNRRLGHTALT